MYNKENQSHNLLKQNLDSMPLWHKDFLANKIMLQQTLDNTNIAFNIPSPSYVLCFSSLESNITLLENVSKESGADILVALKGYSFWRAFEPIYTKLHGATCSGLHETLLAFDTIITPCLQQEDMVYNIIFALMPYLEQNYRDDKSIADKECIISLLKSNNICTNSIESIHTFLKAHDDWKKISKEIPYAFFHSFIQKEICVFAPAYKDSQICEILNYATHIIFNSFGQWERLKPYIDKKNAYLKELYERLMIYKKTTNCSLKIPDTIPQIQVGLRINPLYSEVTPHIYNPCIPKSRLGIIPSVFHSLIADIANKYGFLDTFEFFRANFSGLHFHTHCEQDSSALSRTLPHVIKHFGDYIQYCKWVNFGGGHHITRNDYDCSLLVQIIRDFRAKYNGVRVILEPGEAIGWQTGDLIGEVVDIIENDGLVAILDVSASCHMPDCLEMPYRPECYKISKLPNGNSYIENDLGVDEGAYRYRFGGPTCLAGDIIGDYSFNTPLQIGDKIAFIDMIHYTIVKNTTFNGVELPSLCMIKDNTLKTLKQFDYTYFKERN